MPTEEHGIELGSRKRLTSQDLFVGEMNTENELIFSTAMDHEKKETEKSNQMMKFTIKSLKVGLPSCLTYGDISVCLLIVKLIFGKSDDLDLISATSYFATFLGFCVQCVEIGVTEALGIVSSKAAGLKDWKTAHLRLK